MLTLETLNFLRTRGGERLLAETAILVDETVSELGTLSRLRRHHSSQVAGAAVETVMLRRRAARKFQHAAQMFFTRDGLEQASSEAVSERSAGRFSGYNRIADLCCGIGGDTIALARTARVLAVDRDPLRLAIARANAEVCGVVDRIEFLQADVRAAPLRSLEAVWCDPGRRTGGRRIFDARRYEPPLSDVIALARLVPALAIKVAPGIADGDLPPDCEVEFVQERGDLKQAVLWLGPLATTSRRATILPGGETLVPLPVTPLSPAPPQQVLYEPGPAVIRAHLVLQLGAMLAARQLDETTAFLSGNEHLPTLYAKAYHVHEWMPFNLKTLKRRLRELNVGGVVVKTRASPLDPQELQRSLHLNGPERRTLVLTRVLGRHSVLLCSPV